MEKIKAARGLPQRIKVDDGPKVISRALDACSYFNKVILDHSRAETSPNNPYIKFFSTASWQNVKFEPFHVSGVRQRQNRALAKGLQRVPSAQRYFNLMPAYFDLKTGSEAV